MKTKSGDIALIVLFLLSAKWQVLTWQLALAQCYVLTLHFVFAKWYVLGAMLARSTHQTVKC